MSRQIRRREILKAGAAAAVSVSFGTRIGCARAASTRAQIDAVLRRATDAGEVPGVVAVAATDKGILDEGAFGTRDLTNGPAMTPDTIFRIASMTKAVTSVAAMQLVEQGKLDLERPIGDVLPELAAPQVLEGFDDAGAPRLRHAKRPITMRHLLTIQPGLGTRPGTPTLSAMLRSVVPLRRARESSRRCGCPSRRTVLLLPVRSARILSSQNTRGAGTRTTLRTSGVCRISMTSTMTFTMPRGYTAHHSPGTAIAVG